MLRALICLCLLVAGLALAAFVGSPVESPVRSPVQSEVGTSEITNISPVGTVAFMTWGDGTAVTWGDGTQARWAGQ